MNIQIQDTSLACKRRGAGPVEDRGRAQLAPPRTHPRPRGSLGILPFIAFIALLPGCTASPVNYGVGNNLEGKTLPLGPGVVISDAAPPGILDAGCYGPAAATCSVSWTNDIFPNMQSTGAWQCGNTACHGGGATQPAINDGDPTGTYLSLATYTGLTPAYVVPCNMSTSGCSILCNLTPKGCGSPMPIGTGTPLTTDQLSMIQTWVGCGSPPN